MGELFTGKMAGMRQWIDSGQTLQTAHTILQYAFSLSKS
jgi:hypothetical protein